MVMTEDLTTKDTIREVAREKITLDLLFKFFWIMIGSMIFGSLLVYGKLFTSCEMINLIMAMLAGFTALLGMALAFYFSRD